MDAPPPNKTPQPLLIVEDDAILRAQLARAFADRGYAPLQASDAGQAKLLARRHRPPRALVDLRLPDGSGLALVQALRASLPQCKIVVLTGYGSIATAIEAIRLGATHYLVKPADADELELAFTRDESPPAVPQALPQAPSLARAEWEHINRVLADSGANISEAARRLGIHRRSLQRKLQKYPPRT